MSERSITEIGKYKILNVVGEGAMGVVYRATDPVLARTVAIKVMSEAIARQQELRNRFLREAQAAGSMQHPNIVSIYDLGEMEGHLYIAMEFVEGVDLETIIVDRKPITLQAKLDIILDVLAGLGYAHKRGIIHRDIKPANIRITDDGQAKLMDFGVAHLTSSTLTQTGMVVGTPAYMAPEQVLGTRASPATDLFSVGAVLYELITGAKAFDGPTLQSLFFKIVNEPPVPVPELLPGLPEDLNRVIEKAMAKDPLQRYSTSLEMANDLTRVRASLSAAGSRPGTVSLTATVASAIAQKSQAETRTRQRLIVGAAAVVVVIGVAALVATRGKGEPQQATKPAEPQQVAAAPAVAPPTTTPSSQPSPPAAPEKITTPAPDPKNSARANESRKKKPEAPARVESPARKPAVVPVVTTRKPDTNPVVSRVVAPPPPPAPIIQPSPAPTPAPQPAPPPPPPPPPPVAAAAPSSEGISNVVNEYAQAIESGDIGAVRRVYSGLTGDQQSNLEAFFKGARSIRVSFRVEALSVNGTTADARLVGAYNFVGPDGRPKREPVSVAAKFRHNGSAWRLVSVQ